MLSIHPTPRTLADLFDGKSQLIVYHFMFGLDWKEGCPVAHSTWIIPLAHLAQRDLFRSGFTSALVLNRRV